MTLDENLGHFLEAGPRKPLNSQLSTTNFSSTSARGDLNPHAFRRRPSNVRVCHFTTRAEQKAEVCRARPRKGKFRLLEQGVWDFRRFLQRRRTPWHTQ